MIQKKFRWRPLWIAFSLAVALPAMTLLATVALLRSEAGSRLLIGKLQDVLAHTPLATQPNRFEFADGRIDPFSGFHFRDLHFVYKGDRLSLEFWATAVEAEYRFSLFSRRLEINRLYLENPRLHLALESPENANALEENESRSAKSLEEFILDPSVNVIVRELKLKGLEAHLELQQGGETTLFRMKEADLNFGAEMRAGRVTILGDFITAQPAELSGSAFKLESTASAQWDAALERESGEWVYRLRPSHIALRVTGLTYRESNATAFLSDLKLNTKAALLARSKDLFVLDGNAVETIEVEGKGEARDLRFSEMGSKARRTVRRQEFTFGTRLKERIEISLKHRFDGIFWDGILARELEAKLEARADVSRNLSDANVEGNAAIAGHRILNLSSRFSRKEGRVDVAGQALMDYKPSLARYVRSLGGLNLLGPFALKTEFSTRALSDDMIKAEVNAQIPHFNLAALHEKLSGTLTGDLVWDRVRERMELTSELNVQTDRKSHLRFQSRAAANLATKDIRAQLEINAETKERALESGRFGGKIRVPATVSIAGGRFVTVRGELDLSDAAFTTETWGVTGVSGRIPFHEKLLVKGSKIAFEHLVRLNPFERADFDRVRPLLNGNAPLFITRLNWEERSFGPFIGFFSIRQNRISAHQFNLDAGAGRVYGEMFVDVHPGELLFGVLSRFTALQLNEILPARYLKRLAGDAGRVAGRTGLILDLNRSSIDGRLDITEIGGPQLTALANLVDPDYEDEKLNKVRELLRHGYPTSIGLSFGKGYMDMDIALSVLGVQMRESIRGIPVSSLLSTATRDLVRQLRKGPIE